MYEMITEYYDQGSLKDPGKQESLTMKEKVSIAKDLMEALKDVHAAGYIHGDTHSGNLLLERNQDRSLRDVRYRLVVIDWGTASPISPATDFYERRDLFNAGATLYGLFHNLDYQGSIYGKFGDAFYNDIPKRKDPNSLLIGEINPEITKRKAELDAISRKGALSRSEQFERTILEMLYPTVRDDRDAAYWYDKFSEVLDRY